LHKIRSGINSGLQILEIELTNQCNLNCKHCYVNKDRVFKLKKEKIIDLIKEASDLGVNRLVFTGGEPLLLKEVFDYANYAKELKIPQVVLMTNGILIGKNNISNLKVFDLVQLSLDVPPGEKPHFREDYFEKLEKVIQLLKNNKIKVSLQATLHKSLVPLIKELSDFSIKHDIKIGINRLSPVGGAKNLLNEVLNPNELKLALFKIAQVKSVNKNIGCSDPLLFLVDEKRMDLFRAQPKKKIIGGCLAGVAALYIAANLDIYICPFVRLKVDSLKNKSLSEVWFLNKKLGLLRERDFTGNCGSCEYKSFCGGCRASSLINNGNLFGFDSKCFK